MARSTLTFDFLGVRQWPADVDLADDNFFWPFCHNFRLLSFYSAIMSGSPVTKKERWPRRWDFLWYSPPPPPFCKVGSKICRVFGSKRYRHGRKCWQNVPKCFSTVANWNIFFHKKHLSRTHFKRDVKDSVTDCDCDPHHQARNTLTKAQLAGYSEWRKSFMYSDAITNSEFCNDKRHHSYDCARLMLVTVNAAAIMCDNYICTSRIFFLSFFATFGKVYFLIVFCCVPEVLLRAIYDAVQRGHAFPFFRLLEHWPFKINVNLVGWPLVRSTLVCVLWTSYSPWSAGTMH